jgi:hypothetical protein
VIGEEKTGKKENGKEKRREKYNLLLTKLQRKNERELK